MVLCTLRSCCRQTWLCALRTTCSHIQRNGGESHLVTHLNVAGCWLPPELRWLVKTCGSQKHVFRRAPCWACETHLEMEIKPGAQFASYEEFDRALRKLQLETNAVYVKKTTKSVDVVNAHLTSGAVKLDEKLKFANTTFTCKHGGNFRTRGTGVRPNQR